jgi:hypothetical protein
VQVGASAAAAVTSALAASFFGVAGTLIGAAVGSIVSTIAGALYADYMRRAGRRLRDTKSVVIQRIPSDVLATTPLRHLTGPTDLPGEPSLRPIGDETDDENVTVPLSSPTELLAETGDARETMLMPAYGSAEAEAIYARSTAARNGSGSGSGSGSGGNGARANGSAQVRTAPAPAPRPWWRRPMVTLPAIGIAGFVIAIGTVSVVELFKGGPISGGQGGTSFSKVVTPSEHKQKTTPITKVTPTTAAPTASSNATSPTAVAGQPTAPATVAPSVTTAPPDTATSATSATGAATAGAVAATPSP